MRKFYPVLFGAAIILASCSVEPTENLGLVGSSNSREQLFNEILEKTLARESFSDVKNDALGLDVVANMETVRAEFVASTSEEALFNAFIKLSSARKDRHLAVSWVENGLTPESWPEGNNPPEIMETPLRFAVDFGSDNFDVFVSDFTKDISSIRADANISTGDELVSVGGLSIDDYRRENEPFIRYSTITGFHWKFAESISQKHWQLPWSRYGDSVQFGLRRANGEYYEIELPFLQPTELEWHGVGLPQYDNFTLVKDLQTFDFYVHESRNVILLDWYGFREDLVKDMDVLIEYSEVNGLLNHHVIVDATRARGGSRGAYAVQRLSRKPFKTTYGNVRLSDVIERFVEEKRRDFDAADINDSGVAETIDDGSWLMDWLNQDVMPALAKGDDYSNNVPFKLAHAPKDSDGILEPATVHFSGELIVLLSPHGGSHLDQFASIVADNDLGTIIGMPAGGYSNTWEWEEILTMPGSDRPLVSFMWSIGHTIRPNGEVLEGNPAEVDQYIPLTKGNFASYRDDLVMRAIENFESN